MFSKVLKITNSLFVNSKLCELVHKNLAPLLFIWDLKHDITDMNPNPKCLPLGRELAFNAEGNISITQCLTSAGTKDVHTTQRWSNSWPKKKMYTNRNLKAAKHMKAGLKRKTPIDFFKTKR